MRYEIVIDVSGDAFTNGDGVADYVSGDEIATLLRELAYRCETLGQPVQINLADSNGNTSLTAELKGE